MAPEFDRRTAIKSAFAGAAAIFGGETAFGQENGPQSHSGRKKLDTPIQVNSQLKARSANDYCRSLRPFGGRLSDPIRQLFLTAREEDQVHFGVLVIGSGYGASVCAARLSQRLRPGYRLGVIERGKEWVPGTFPDTMPKVFSQTRNMLTGPTKGQTTNPLGLFNVMMNDEVNILTGNGLGGGSLINASIALRPHTEVFQQERWPAELRDVRILAPYYKRVARAMSLSRTPEGQVPKVRVRRLAASNISRNPDFFDLSNISVMYDHRHLDEQMRNPQGMIQRPCTLCGDCITGCNVGSKNSLVYNYLPVAKWNGAEMYTQCEVNRIEKKSGYYRVHLTYFDDSNGEVTRHSLAVNSRVVVVGAGSPGSTQILMESQSEQMCFSPALGKRWSGNGDTIGFVIKMNCSEPTSIAGHGAFENCNGPVGPTVQSSLNFYRDVELRKRLLIQDAAIPRGMTPLFKALLRDGELNQSMVMLGMGHDGGEGTVIKREGRYQIKWPGLKESPYRQMVFEEFEKLALAHGGRYKRLKAFGNNLVTVHPLGGCNMGDDPLCSVTNHLGQVYDNGCCGMDDRVANVHDGLYVADGSLMPTALGVNPYMTIGALAERVSRHMIANPNHRDLFDAV